MDRRIDSDISGERMDIARIVGFTRPIMKLEEFKWLVSLLVIETAIFCASHRAKNGPTKTRRGQFAVRSGDRCFYALVNPRDSLTVSPRCSITR